MARILELVPYDPALAAAVGWDKAAYSLAKGPFVERALASLRPAG